MPEEFRGKIFTPPEEVENKLSAEEIAAANARFDEFERRRAAVPPEKQIHLRDRFGSEDALGTDREEEYLREVEQRKQRGQYWG
ncbi:hypothetical protein [Nocardia donostiensis]|uniref:Uncharacterized protein n=1 Tax=Nocardia donostiensis TaxID=1538463 RepID=A0A1V2TLM3_9NOCA|nr:hypothetical protein [Nocardia donostiensis]ONM50430.1 hypothetical protein B0T46_00415 [Nocardia donostiensis]OQS17335.1 hypothetical protein B0T36_01745 [Nocardia donostiensis]OQS18719.1 hypothetical protein B0T44_17980 [Nocardia donostiensis]